MRQKKKTEVDSSEDATVDASGDCCNGYHRGALKSALKRNTKSKSSKKKHRVQFDESLNKFFDADYVILIREDPEDGDGVCECGEELCYDCTEDEDLGLPEEVQSPRFDLCAAFEPPMEFVDQVTLSPPDGYKDISQGCCPHHFHQRRLRPDDREGWEESNPVSRPDVKESKNEEEEIEPSGSTAVAETRNEDLIPANEHLSPSTPLSTNALHHHQQLQHHQQSLQQTPSQPQQQQRYIVETITMTTVTERRIVREADDQIQSKGDGNADGDGKLSGILKGGKLWKSTDSDDSQSKPEQQWSTPDDPDGRRSVRFCDGQTDTEDLPAPPPTELTLTFKLGNHVMVSNNSRPNSAVRQLFPAQRFMSPPPQPNRSPDSEDPTKTDPKYLVTTENLRLFDESKKSKIKQYFQPGSTKNKDGSSQTVTSPQQESQAFAPASDDEDSLQNNLIKRTIERNTLRRSLLRYPHDSARLKRNQNKMKTENSLVERIKQLTCDVEEEQIASGDEKQTEEDSPSFMPPRTSPPGEEAKPLPIRSEKIASSSGMSSTYKKLTDLFTRRSDKLESHTHNSMVLQTPASIEHQYPYYQPVYQQATSPPDLGNGLNTHNLTGKNNVIARTNSTTEARKQFLSTLAPLTACVSGSGEDSPVNKDNPGDRNSVASTSTSTAADTEYSLDDIEEALVDEPGKTAPQPDVVAGTPAGDTQDELALFVQQDASRIERLRKRYGSTPTASTAASEDDEQDDYGFNRRPSVRGIKPRFGSTTEILQQMQSQLQPPPPPGSHVSWPYYSPDIDPRMGRSSGSRNQMPILKEDGGFAYVQSDSPIPEYPSSSPVDGSARYQHLLYSSTGNLHQPMRIGGGGSIHHVHSESPPPGVMVPLQEVPGQMYTRRALPGGSLVQMQVPVPVRLPHYTDDPHYPATSIIRVGQGQQQTIRVPYPSGTPVQVHLLATRRGDSPQRPPHLVVARGTQTSSISTTYYQLPPPPPRTSYPLSIRGPLVYSATHDKPPHLAPYSHARSSSPTIIPSLTSSPTRMKPHATERGVPEGAASSSPAFPQDSVYSVQVSTSTNIPSPQDIDITNRVQGSNNSTQPPNNPVFYAMNV